MWRLGTKIQDDFEAEGVSFFGDQVGNRASAAEAGDRRHGSWRRVDCHDRNRPSAMLR